MPLMDVDIEKAKKQYDVNVWGLFAVTQACFPMLKAAKGTVFSSVKHVHVLINTKYRDGCKPIQHGRRPGFQSPLHGHLFQFEGCGV